MSDGTVTRVAYNGFSFEEPAENTTTPPTEPASTPAVQINENTGLTIRSTTREDGSVQADSSGALRMGASELFGVDPKGGVLATAVSHAGRPLSAAEVQPSSIVTIDNDGVPMTLTVAGAVVAGYLKIDEHGRYANTTESERSGAASEAPAEDAGREAFTSHEHERALEAIATSLPESLQHRLVSHFVLDKPMTETDVDDYAAASGQSRETFLRNAMLAFTGFHTQAEEVERAMGITAADKPALSAWLATQPEAVRRVKTAMAYERNTSEYKALLNAWYRATPPSEDALRAAGYTLTKNGAGQTLVTIDGVPILLSVAAKQGML